jgi:hypothetical protein
VKCLSCDATVESVIGRGRPRVRCRACASDISAVNKALACREPVARRGTERGPCEGKTGLLPGICQYPSLRWRSNPLSLLKFSWARRAMAA